MNVEWLPIIAEGISWIKEKMGPSKKELVLEMTDLKNQLKTLSYGNATAIENMEQIILALIDCLNETGNYTINIDNIIQATGNEGYINIIYNKETSKIEEKRDGIFDGIDEEITQYRLNRPSEKGE